VARVAVSEGWEEKEKRREDDGKDDKEDQR
jgi:hypothetical protein